MQVDLPIATAGNTSSGNIDAVGLLRWEWTLANRSTVVAVVDTDLGVEKVSQGGRVLSEAPRGSRRDGHTVLVEPRRDTDGSDRPPIEAVVTFDPTLPICVLRVDGHDIAPLTWPVRSKVPPPPEEGPWKNYALFGVFVACVVLFAVLLVTRHTSTEGAMPTGPLAGKYRAASGLFIAHFPDALEAKPAVLPIPLAGILLEDKAHSVAVVIAAMPAESAAGLDAWTLQQRLRDEAVANLPKETARFEEATRSDETCAGEHGAAVAGYLVQKGTRRSRVWSCAFKHDGAGYFALYMVPASASAEDLAKARSIVDAMELTHLADLGTAEAQPTTAK